MSIQESNENRSGSSLFRMTLDLVMGSVYIVLAGVVFYYKKFGTIDLSGWVIYGMSGLLIIYGAFRIYMGYNRYKGR